MWRVPPPPAYHSPKSTVRDRHEGWCWILGSDRSNRRSLSGAETPNSSMKRQLPAVHLDSTTLPYLYNGTLFLLCILCHRQSQELLAMLNQPCFGWLDITRPKYLSLAFRALCARQLTNTTQKHCWVLKDITIFANALYYSSGNDRLVFPEW